jgi:hypothetical protein
MFNISAIMGCRTRLLQQAIIRAIFPNDEQGAGAEVLFSFLSGDGRSESRPLGMRVMLRRKRVENEQCLRDFERSKSGPTDTFPEFAMGPGISALTFGAGVKLTACG